MKTKLMLAVLVLCAGCDKTIYEASDMKTEPASVVDLVYMPKNHGSDVAIGFTSNGGTSITPVSVDLPERYAVVFQCQHGKFIVESNQEKAKALYHRLSRDQKVVVSYREIYGFTKISGTNSPKNFVKFEFVDAK